MGIQGLLKFLDPITLKQHLSSFQNQRAAIDMMSWIYKGCYRCAFEHNQNIESNAFLYYILQMLDLLSHYNIKPICVFDGRYVGKKDETIQKRKKAKQQNRQKGLQFLNSGNEEQARKYLSRCIIIDQRIITLTIKALYTKGVQYIVSPYESDSQIAKLIQLGLADFAITQDSDLIVYNAKVILKLTQDGQCDYIDLQRWKAEDVDQLYLKMYLNMSVVNRTQSAILAGSDYNNSIRGIGIKKAIKHLHQRKTMNAVIQHLKHRKPFCNFVPENYQLRVLHSKLIFIFATVFNPSENRLQFLNQNMIQEIKPQDIDIEELKTIVGPFFNYNADVRLGRVNVRTNEPRLIEKIDIKSVFQLNPHNLIIRQGANKKRREMYQQQKKRRDQERRLMAESGQQITITSQKCSKNKKPKAPVMQLTQEEKKQVCQQRKIDRIRRFDQFKNVLNNLVMEYSSQSESSSEESDLKQNVQKLESNKKSIITVVQNQQNKEVVDQSDGSEIESQSLQLGLQSLNPWAKPK